MKRRSQHWFSGIGRDIFIHRSFMKKEGHGPQVFDGRPVIGICNSWSQLTTCNSHLRTVADAVKRGVWQAGGFPLEFPTISLGEPFVKPTTMLYRNLMAMDVEEMIRANPLDGVVLLGGCDKTVPAQLMGAASADLPAIVVTGGPMLKGNWRGRTLGSGSDAFKMWDEVRAGRLSEEEFEEMESCISRSAGHCMVMGTASTMACVTEALGMTLPGGACIPAPDSRRLALAEAGGRRIVEMVESDLRPSQIMTLEAMTNAIRVLMAVGGSTNAVVHVIALGGRLGLPVDLDLFDELSRSTPCILNLRPSGEYLMEDFFLAGGLPVVMDRISHLLQTDCMTVSGKTLGQNLDGAENYDEKVILDCDRPLSAEGGVAVLRGNLAPGGAIIKPTAASEHLLVHEGPALVFRDRVDLFERIDAPDLPVSEDSVLVLRNSGPVGGPGMPEWGNVPIPKKLLARGVKDMVRISDARMSGTAYGAVVLHVCPESAIGGPLALVRDGDRIKLDTPGRRLDLLVSERELEERKSTWEPPAPAYTRGYGRLFLDHVLQADKGCDFDFLIGSAAGARDLAPFYAALGGVRQSRGD